MLELKDGKKILTTPVSEEDLKDIHIGDIVYLNGSMTTCRDVAHRRLVEGGRELPVDVRDAAIFHAGPIIRPLENDKFEMVSVGPTTSMRMEKFEKEFVEKTGVKVIIGKGGMGPNTEYACKNYKAIHCVFPAGNAVVAATEVEEIVRAEWRDLGMPETLWNCRVKEFGPLIVSIDTKGNNLFEKNKIREHQKALTARVEKLVRPAQKMSEWEKEKYVHDFICENVRYDKLKKAYSHEIIGPLGQSVGVCEGIAKAVKVLLDALGVWCVIAICGNNPEKGIKYRHTWNIVKINGIYYHLDATFDNSLGKDHENTEIRYDYFNLDDQQIFRDHEPLIAPAPHCNDHDHFYYKEKKLSFTKQEDVYKRSLQAAKKGKVLVFHWRGGYLTKEVLNELLDLIRKAGMEKEKNAMVSINWPQAVLRVQYADIQVQESVMLEEANEGEKD